MGIWVGVPMLGLVAEGAPVRLFSGLFLSAFLLGYMPASNLVETTEPVRLGRRLSAFAIDLAVLFLILHPILSQIHLAAAAAAGVALVFCWFWLHLSLGRATPGRYIMGYRIIAHSEGGANGEPEYAHRALSSFVALLLWPVTWIAVTQKDSIPGTYHWDRQSHTQAVRVVSLRR